MLTPELYYIVIAWCDRCSNRLRNRCSDYATFNRLHLHWLHL